MAAADTGGAASDAAGGAPAPGVSAFQLELRDWETLAWAHLDEGDAAGAARAADVRRALAPDDLAWRRSWIEILAQTEDRRDEAMAEARRMVAEHPDDAPARRLLARLLVWGDQQEEARAIYDDLIAEDPADLEALKARAEMAQWDHDALTAERLLQQAAEVAPDDEAVAADLAVAKQDASRMRAARTDPTLPVLLGIVVVPTLIGFASRTVSAVTWGVLVLWVATLLWGVAHLVGVE